MRCYPGRRLLPRKSPHLAVASLLVGCAGVSADGEDDAESTGETGGDALHCSQAFDEDGRAWLELGQGSIEYEALEPGGELRIVLGGQGLLMFPVDLRAGGFCVPPDLSDRDEFPVLDIDLDVEGEPAPFISLHDQPIDFDILEDDTYMWIHLPLVLPDAADPASLVGRGITVDATLVPHDHAPLQVEMQQVIGVEE